ncbi:hypothetical protein Mal48_49180 [Thalassoglobus polymorphus]|uniref:Uncharacterized protein n=1 Tax=Thalassoglobus polymorphus TaxID=2527994 RepID=A0A517QVK9_9PLAN|nr:hypothetical protein Mal48_49180 [Thalassoglobus polymorphus]
MIHMEEFAYSSQISGQVNSVSNEMVRFEFDVTDAHTLLR